MTRREWTLFSILAAIWGASYLFIKIGLEDLPPAAIVFVRTALAALVLLPVAARLGALRGLGGQLGPLALLAAVQVAGPFLLIAVGEQEISSSLTGILVASAPIFTALLAIRVDQEERLHGWRLAGIVLGILGVVLLLGIDAGGGAAALLGGLLVVVASLGYAIGGFILKRRLSEPPAVAVGAVTLALSALMVAPLGIVGLAGASVGPGPAAAVAALGVFGTGISFWIFYWLIARVGPSRASLVAYVAPGFAVVYGVTLLGESFTAATAAGLALIVGGSWLAAEGRPGRREAVVAEAVERPAVPVRRAA